MKVASRLALAVAVAIAVGLIASAAQVERRFGGGRPPRLVFDVALPAMTARGHELVEAAWTSRLAGRAPRFALDQDGRHELVTVDGGAADVDATAQSLSRVGRLELYEVASDTPTARAWFQRAHAGELGPDVEGVPDSWTHDRDGATSSDYYLKAPTAQALDRAVERLAQLEPLPDDLDVFYEQVIPQPDAGDSRPPYVRTYLLRVPPRLAGHHIARADVTYDQNTLRPQVLLRFSDEGRQLFADLTRELVGHKLAIVLDRSVVSAPIIQTPIAGGVSTITMGGADAKQQQADATALVDVLRTGRELPDGIVASLRDRHPGSRGLIWLPRLALALLAGLGTFVVGGWLARRPSAAAVPPLAPGVHGLVPAAVALVVTLGLPALIMVLAPHLPLPGVDRHLLAVAGRDGIGREDVSVFTLGVTSMLTGFWLVELVAALTPRWRSLRLATSADRRGLDRAAVATGLVIATIQGYFVARYLQAAGPPHAPVLAPGAVALVVAVLSAVTGVAAQVVVADLISRHGLGNGYVALLGVGTARALYRTLDIAPALGHRDLRLALVAALAVIALVVVTASALRDRSPARRRLPWVGIVPIALLAIAAGLALLVLQLLSLPGGSASGGRWLDHILAPPAWLDVAAAVVATAGLIVARGVERTRDGLGVTLAVIALLLLVRHLTPVALSINAWILPAVLLVGLGVELALALRARLGLREPVAILAVHDVDRADRAADTLAAAGIPASVEGLRTRAILRGLGGFAPIVLRVAAVEADAARAAIAAVEAERDPALAAFAA